MRKAYIILVLIALAGCDRQRNHPGWDYFPDMFYSTAYETYTENPNFEDGKTMRTPVEGTIPRDHMPFGYDISPESRAKAGAELVNPFTTDQVNIERGQKAYVIYCQQCHGPAGAGDGYLFTSGLYPMKPRPIAGEAAAPLRDGEIYHTITLGFGSMGPHGSLVRPDDRWKIILFIRQLQQNTSNK
ncbi:MAG TPA: cytochrome c [Bacteroidales bacterium]|jgi:cytochrome c1|nr:cytochrome c [Bacteroidales bacterium]